MALLRLSIGQEHLSLQEAVPNFYDLLTAQFLLLIAKDPGAISTLSYFGYFDWVSVLVNLLFVEIVYVALLGILLIIGWVVLVDLLKLVAHSFLLLAQLLFVRSFHSI